MAVKAPSDQVQRVLALALDAAFYRSAYPDVAGAGADPLRHYALTGWREGRDPAPWFSTKAYLAANADVASAGAEPLHHYLTRGRYEGRDVHPSDHAQAYFTARRVAGEVAAWSAFDLIAPSGPSLAPSPAPVHVPASEPVAALEPEPSPVQRGEDHRELVAGEFDVTYYLSCHPDIEAAGVDPLAHFVTTGWREGRDPASWFSVRDYLEVYPDVAAAGLNPFVHYLRAGRAEGRIARQDLGFRYDILSNMAPVEDRVALAARATAAETLSPVSELKRTLAASRTGLKDLHVTFSHDDYAANLGGVQLCLQREAAKVASLGLDHLHLYPARPWPVVRTKDDPGALGVVWNGKPAGIYAPKDIAAVLAKAAGPGRARSFAIHSLLGHSVGETVTILASLGLKEGWFWLHDFASLCAGFHLLRDDVQDCAAPPPDSAACGICAYGPWRARHLEAHAELFAALDLTVVSPSEPTLSLWRRAASYPSRGEIVLPHVSLVARGPAPVAKGRRRFRLAFAGMPAAHKGWPVFRELAARFGEDPRYEFLHLGGRTIAGLPIGFTPVTVTAATPKAMQQAIEDAQVDAVLVWPLCRETFSFTAYEAVAAGAAVITNPDSGNVAAFVEAGGHGRVVADEPALAALLESGDIRALARARRKPQLYDLAFSDMTAGLLQARATA